MNARIDSPSTIVAAALVAVLGAAAIGRAQDRKSDEKKDPATSWRPSESEAQQARRTISDLLEGVKDGPDGVPAGTLDAIARRIRLPELVSLLDQPFDATRAREAQAAAQLVKRAGKAARPYLARAVAPDVETAPSVLLLAAVRALGDEEGAIEKPLLARTTRILALGGDAADLLATLARIGTARSLGPLTEALLKQGPGANLARVGAAAAEILGREKDPDAHLGPLVAKLTVLENERLGHTLPLVARSRGAAVPTLQEVVRRLDRETDTDRGSKDVDSVFAEGLTALARIGTADALAALARLVRESTNEAHRTRAIVTMLQAEGLARYDAALALAGLLDDSNLTRAEKRLVNDMLVELTGEYASESAGWRELVTKKRTAAATKKK